jgi:uncharacterized protein (DUF488 family)
MMLTTIGYEGAALDDFLATLKRAKVAQLLDIRELPISRRKGFAKSALSVALEAAGIAYFHLKGLGDPKEGREAARAGDMGKFARVFLRHMKTKEARAELDRAVQLIGAGGGCLMCYERDPKLCHRTLVANAISGRIDIRIRHLGVRNGIAHDSGWTGAGPRPR